MFERFTDRARRVLVLAQQEARLLNHNFIGTEHILLGLLHERDGIAAQALTQMGVSLESVRQKVEEEVGVGDTAPPGSPPFTPRAIKVLELSLRESMQLGQDHIGTEHLLLGLVEEGEGVGAQVLVTLGAALDAVRETVIQRLEGHIEPEAAPTREPIKMTSGAWTSRAAIGFRRTRVAKCSFCGRQPPETGRLIAGDNAYICENCIDEFSEEEIVNDEDSDEP